MSMFFGIMCRLCMRYSKSMKLLFEDDSTLSENIMILIPTLKIYAGDNLPSQICQDCVDQINCFNSFRLQCENSDLKLKKYFQNHRSKKGLEMKSDLSSDSFISQEKELEDNYKNEDGSRLVPSIQANIGNEEYNCGLLEANNTLSVSTVRKSRVGVNKSNKSSKTLTNTSVSCPLCEKVVVKKRLNEHIRRHTVGRPFNCEECGKTFIDRSSLMKHFVIHSGLRVHMCDICSKSFKHLAHLKTHHLTHTGQKLYICDVCGKRFSQIGNLKNHELLHKGEKPFGCNLCDKRFTEKRTLKIHLATHTGDKQHICEICGKVFLLKGYLNKHLVVHSGVKKFSCDICGMCYTQRHSLRKHEIKHSVS